MKTFKTLILAGALALGSSIAMAESPEIPGMLTGAMQPAASTDAGQTGTTTHKARTQHARMAPHTAKHPAASAPATQAPAPQPQ